MVKNVYAELKSKKGKKSLKFIVIVMTKIIIVIVRNES